MTKLDQKFNRINKINSLTGDIQALQNFLSDLEQFKDERIQKLFIVTDQKHSIELIGHFSKNASASLFNLIIESRNKLIEQMETLLKEYLVVPKNE
jgi:cytoplasmic iron level regulating protein YaaA (DUF328/UPF0246 family)